MNLKLNLQAEWESAGDKKKIQSGDLRTKSQEENEETGYI